MTNLIFWLPLALALVLALARVIVRLGAIHATFSKESPMARIDRKGAKSVVKGTPARVETRPRIHVIRRNDRR